ncbi:MAG: DUF58 domain-containing protein [Lachnospiraceae bacterium]|nr:DUF58 domain-containing protein [Lachnospiraceae bacterium]
MRMNYISKIQASMRRYKMIHTHHATSRILDGSYNSIYKGRSMNFDELREYVPGDEVKDIDWKASSRSQRILVRQYIAEKKHNIMLVMDTNRRMLADTAENEEKREVAIMSAGVLAYLVNSNGDYVSAIYPTEKSLQYFPFKTGLPYIENILNQYHKEVTIKNRSSLDAALDYVLKNIHRKMIMIIVSDLQGIYDISETTLKRLLLTQDILVMNISDAKITGKKVYSIEEGSYMPPFLSENKKLARIESRKQKELKDACEQKLKKYGIAMTTIDHVDEIDTRVIALLEHHRMDNHS